MIPLAINAAVWAPVIAALVALVSGYIAVRGNSRSKQLEAQVQQQGQRITERGQNLADGQASYDQLQEDIAAMRGELASVKKAHSEEIAALRKTHSDEIADVRADYAASQKRERVLEGYVWDLRRDIEKGAGPPPRPWPEELD